MKIKGDYLYLLAFDNRPYFKIGISSSNFNRVCVHNNNYKISYYNSFIITAPKRIVKSLESELLVIYPEIMDSEFKDIDGYTEIRNIKYLSECVKYIKSKHINLNIDVYNAFDLMKRKIINVQFINKGSDFELELNLMTEIFEEWKLIEMIDYAKKINVTYNAVKYNVTNGNIPFIKLSNTIFIIEKLSSN